MAPTPPFRVDLADSQNGHFHSISLRSPADQPVVLSFDDGLCNGTLGEKSPASEGNSQGLLINASPTVNSSKCSNLARFLRRLFSSRHFLLTLVALLSLLALLLVVSLVLVILLGAQRQQQVEDEAFLNRDSSWRDGCERKCNAKFDVPPLLLISMDGFRADYLQRKITPSVSRIMQCGASAEYMLPSYPSKTFPNHFSIVTGLYPESHGIVDNHFYDEEMPGQKNFAKSSRNPAWYNGEPIWNTVSKNGKKSAIFFWPGSEVPIQGQLPTYQYQYNASLPFSKRVDQVIDWLRFEETDRPAFLAMYFEQPDTAMHREGPESDAVNSALIYVDAMINYLTQQLDNNGLLGCINLVILSDHGAQKLREDHFIALDKYVDEKDPEVGGVYSGTIGHINFRSTASPALVEQVLAPMSCLGGQTFRVYTRQSMPKRYHYTKSGRIGEIVIDSVGGTRLFNDQRSMKEYGPLEKGDHGYDNRMREMRTIFGAWGPSVQQGGYVEKPFQNIELYNLFTALMQLPVSAPNNGTLGRLNQLLRAPPSIESTASMELAECEGARLLKCGDGCHFGAGTSNIFDEDESGKRPLCSVQLNYQPGSVPSSPGSATSQEQSSSQSADEAVVPVYNGQHCKYADRIVVPAQLASRGQLCLIRLCNSTLVFNRRIRMANFVESLLSAPIPNIDHRANCTGHFVVPATTTTAATEETHSTGSGEEEASSSSTDEGNVSAVKRSRSADDQPGAAVPETDAGIRESDPTLRNVEDAVAPWNRPAETAAMASSSSPADEEATSTEGSTTASTTTSSTQSSNRVECSQMPSGPAATGDAANGWISLFSDNDYARYIAQGQFRVPAGFYNGPWKQVLSLIRQYMQHYRRLLMWTGPVFDHNHDGLADPVIWGGQHGDREGQQQQQEEVPSPSHIFLILLRCSNNTWHPDGRQCEQAEKTKTLAFVLPLLDKDLNCLFPVEYIFRHTARIRDIELLTGNEWFLDRDIYPAELANLLRTQLNEQLWQLELRSS